MGNLMFSIQFCPVNILRKAVLAGYESFAYAHQKFTCSKSTIEILEKGMKYVKS